MMSLLQAPHDKPLRIVNVVGSGYIGQTLDLEYLVNHLPHNIYEPEQFPGLMYRPFNDQVVCLIFSTGKIVIVGAKSESQILKTFQYTEDILQSLSNDTHVPPT